MSPPPAGRQFFFRAEGQRAVLEERLRDHHEERGGHALVRNVRHRHHQMPLVEEEKIVKVAADLFRGLHGREKIELASRGKLFRQDARLYARRHRKLRLDTLLFRRSSREIREIGFQLAGHLVEAVGQRFDLVARLDVELFVEVAARYVTHARRQRENRTDESVRNFAAGIIKDKKQREKQRRRPQEVCPEKIAQRRGKILRPGQKMRLRVPRRLHHHVPVNQRAEAPSHAGDRRVRQIIFLPLHRHQIHIGQSLHHAHGFRRQILLARLAKIHGRAGNSKNAFLF